MLCGFGCKARNFVQLAVKTNSFFDMVIEFSQFLSSTIICIQYFPFMDFTKDARESIKIGHVAGVVIYRFFYLSQIPSTHGRQRLSYKAPSEKTLLLQ